MTLVRYNPLANFVPGTFGDLMESALKESNSNTFVPQVDITKGEKSIELHIVAPGMSKADFSIDLDENKLTISGERKSPNSDEVAFIKRETKYGNFSRSFKLTEDINKEEINASYNEGILKVTLPLIEKKVNKATIKIQ